MNIVNYSRKKFLKIINRNTRKWKRVMYPLPKNNKPLIILIIIIFLESYIFLNISRVFIVNSIFIRIILETLLLVIYSYLLYKQVSIYKKFKNKNKREIERKLRYLIHSLKFYDEEIFEFEEIDRNRRRKIIKEKKIVRVIGIYFKEDEKRVYVKVIKSGDRFTKIAAELSENLESALGLELEKTNQTVNYCEYIFLKSKDRRINLNSSIEKQERYSDRINITGNISYRLSKTPHSLIVGGTGSGKSFFILGKIVSYLNLVPRADLYIIDPKKADLSLLRFIKGLENKVVTEPNQIAQTLREVCQMMEGRYEEYFNDVSAFGKDYTDFGLPPIIVIFDEFSAFLHSVDKKLSKEVLDYIFTMVMKGRQAGVQVEILMQRPSADDLPTNIRAQMGFKAGLGNMDKIGYKMIFDNDMDYKSISEKGGGYIQIDGLHREPVYFETPFIDSDFDFIREIEKIIN